MNTTKNQAITATDLTSIEAALRDERKQQEQERLSEMRSSKAVENRASRVGSTLRFAGVTALLAAAGAFLTQHWTDASYLSRYGMFLLFTALVTGAGVFCSSTIKEQKGARAFLGVTVMFLPVHFAQLGALLFSQFGSVPESAVSYYPYLYWEAPSLGIASAVTALGIAALLPMAYFAFSALARNHADKLLRTTFVCGAALLIPTREPAFIAAILGSLAIFSTFRDQQISVFPEMRTVEGRAARLVPFVTIITMIGRQCALYNASAFLVGLVLVGLSYAAMGMRAANAERSGATAFAEVVAWMLAIPGMLAISYDICESFRPAPSIEPLFLGLPLGAVMIHLERRARVCSLLFKTVAVLSIGLTFVAEYSYSDSLLPSTMGLILAIVAVTTASAIESKTLFWIGAVGCVASLLRMLELCINLHVVSPWIVLGVIGTAAVIGGSYIERNFTAILERFRNRRLTVISWK